MKNTMKYKKNFSNKDEFLKKYETVAEGYDKHRLKDYEGKKVLEGQLNLLTKNLKTLKPKKILEAGCGTGRILLPLTKKGFKIEGFDLSKNMLSILNKKNPSIKTKIGDIEKIPYKNETFDFVYSITVLIHLPKIEKAISELYRVTKKDGILIFDLSNKDSIWTKLSVLIQPNKKRTILYSRKDIKKILKKYNYEITGLFSYGRIFYKVPIIKYVASFLDKNLPLPISFRSQYIIKIKK